MSNTNVECKPHFIVAAPPKTPKSAGVMALWNLADSIEAAGYQTTRLNFTAVEQDKYVMSLDGHNWVLVHETSLPTLLQDIPFPIVISGETTDCKYFGTFNFCRYHLHKMGMLLNKGNMKNDEYHIVSDRFFYEKPNFYLPQFLGKVPLERARSIETGSRTLDLTYVGKASMYTSNLEIMPNTVELTRDWPSENDQYLTLLMHTRFLYTYDPLTSVNLDAILMGAVPILLSYAPFDREDWLLHCGDGFIGYLPDGETDFDEFLLQFPSSRLGCIDHCIRMRDDFSNNVKHMCEDIIQFFQWNNFKNRP